ncbi:M28 family metallopeptidase [Chromatocurvus halotolerans]|uniref:PA domain-containing protein n=1 Tax=Chromatocurvus halotolerans TaxID=1132028 RepID=A0A4R2KXR9_9GAMM|nr:M28 family metallopeptidase [Chromatocurvus halotolerans]TCO76096.1 PA domain-containing protein [Chromatocurvus halotolerans]
MIRSTLTAGVLAGAALFMQPPAGAQIPDAVLAGSAANIEADVRFLGDDLLEGREAGTRGFDLAALYVATQYRLIGLEPAGDDGSYFQSVPLIRGVRDREGARFAITRGDEALEFVFEDEYLPAVNFSTGEESISAPMVFVGQAVAAPHHDHDDFAGVDVAGKIAVVLNSAPASFPDAERAYYAHRIEKWRALEERGAVGMITLGDPEREAKRPWSLDAPNWKRPFMRRLDADGRPADDFPGLRVRVSASVGIAERVFAGSPYTAAEVFAMLEAGELVSFDLAGEATLSTRATLDRLESSNVVARLPGSDPALSQEHIVMTAHLDHVGFGAPVNGDTLYNGVQDNAMGTATMLETARLLADSPESFARSFLFVALTAEEKGLLGAYHYANTPTVPADGIVANVNMDMPVIIGDVTDVIPIGIEHSTLGDVTERAVAQADIVLTPDPAPEEVVFVRSDQYPFVRAGIPAVYLKGGVKLRDGGDGEAIVKAFRAKRYHLPSDDLDQPLYWPAAGRLAYVNYRIGSLIANDPERPQWLPDSFFGQTFGKH